ncbi:hypothetical protein V6N13_104553 [Hibiscus sabdariffa]|uniref:Uncharacterized protein n=1 Tax=Hibiscus sabdariffa TaxID=183260 RepID=A0ABR2DD24_9ROSI
MHLEKLKVDEKEGQLKSLEKEKANLLRDLQALEEEFKQVSLKLRQKNNMYTAKKVRREKVESLKARISDLEEQNKEYLEQLEGAEKQRDHSQQMMQQVGQHNEWLHQKIVELEEAYQGLGAQLKTTNIFLNMDEREMVYPLRRAREWIQDHVKIMEMNESYMSWQWRNKQRSWTHF